MIDLGLVLGLLATATFSITGVLAARTARIDLFGVLVVGVVTAVGGGTLRDLILDVPVFWISDAVYLWIAALVAIMSFFLLGLIHRVFQLLLYLDALGVALFATMAVHKTLALGLGNLHAVVMGVITGIGGGLIRDLLTGRPTLIMQRDLYATPILLGLVVQIGLITFSSLDHFAAIVLGGATIFLFRALAIFYHWQMPDFLVTKNTDR